MARITNSAKEKILQIKQFKGLHETKDSDTKIATGEATQCFNFRVTRDGNLQRRPGNRVIARIGAAVAPLTPVIGMWCGWVGGKEYILAACNGKLIKVYDGTGGTFPCSEIGSIYGSATKVCIFGFNDKAYILDGNKYWEWDGTTFQEVEGYIPLVANAIGPIGTAEAAGTLLEQINKLTVKRRVWISPDGTHNTFQLPEAPVYSVDSVIDLATNTAVTTGWSASTSTGVVTFTSPPAKAVNSYEINYSVSTDYRNDVVKMKFAELYSGASDNRVFLYGDGSNQMLYSDIDYDGVARADYFPDLNHVAVGDANTPVTGAIRHFSRLIIYKPDSTWSLSASTLSLEDGSLIPSFYVNPINRTIGNEAPGQVQLVLNSPRNLFKNELYEWRSSNRYSGDLTSDERQAVRISDRICKTLPSFSFANCVCYDDNPHQEYYIVNPTTGIALVHNYAVDAWYKYDNVYATHFCTLNNKLYWGSTYGEIQCFDETLRMDLLGTTEIPAEIVAIYETGNMDFGADYMRKYSSTMWVGVKPETNSFVQIGVITDRRESLDINAIKLLSKSSNAVFAMWDFNDVSFDNGEQPKMAKIKLKAKKFVYYKLILLVADYDNGDKHVDALDRTVTVTSIDIRSRQTGYAK